jgi:transcriptional regulator with XRE-family HTH domain
MSANPSGFGRVLKQLREAAGLTQEQLAERAAMHKFGVAKLEQGLREPSWATVQALANALGTNCLAFVDDGEITPTNRHDAKRGRPRKVSVEAGGDNSKKTTKQRKKSRGS